MRAALITVLAATALAGCQGNKDELTIENPRVRLAANPANPAAAYFTIKGGPQADKLLSVTTEINLRSELHETTGGDHGEATMHALPGVDIPARGTVEFKPGGKHVMLFGMQPNIKPYETVALTFTFASGTRLVTNAKTRGAGDVL